MNILKIEEEADVYDYLIKRDLIKQYKKAKALLILWNARQVDFKIRNPKKDQIYYFRINKQFRALCHFEWNNLIVFKIDNHQN